MNYDNEFKKEAVKLSDEIGVRQAAEQLGISYHTLSGWRSKRKQNEVINAKPVWKEVTCPKCNFVQSVPPEYEPCFCGKCGSIITNRKRRSNNLQTGKAVVCPACSATVRASQLVNASEYAICEYCGTQVFFDCEAQKAYEIRMVEEARRQARKIAQKKLLDDLIDMEEAALNYDRKCKLQSFLVDSIDQLNKQENRLIGFRGFSLYVCPIFIVVIIFVFALNYPSVYSFIIGGIFSIAVYLCFTISHYRKSKAIARKIEDSERSLLETIDDLNLYKETLERHKEIKLPKAMLNKGVYDCVLGLIVKNDLDSLSEAISLYRYLEQQRNYEEMQAAKRQLENEKMIAAKREEEKKEPKEESGSILGMLAGVGVGLVTAGLFGGFFDD